MISEAVTVADGSALSSLTVNTNLGKYSIYELTLEKQAARTTAEITGFSVYDAYSKNTVNGTISGTNITITLPYYFVDSNRENELYLDYSVRGGESLAANDSADTVLKDLTMKNDKVDTANSTEIAYNSTDKKLTVGTNVFDKITVTAEAGAPSVDYTVTVKIADANTEAKLNLSLIHILLSLKPGIEVNNADGSMHVGKKYRGTLKKVLPLYVRDKLTQYGKVKQDHLFITYSTIDPSYVELVRQAVEEVMEFREIHVTTASCTIACHCGPNTLGILFETE